VQLVQHHDEPGSHHPAIPQGQPLRRQPRADARRLPGLSGTVIRNTDADDGWEIAMMRWGMPPPPRRPPIDLWLLTGLASWGHAPDSTKATDSDQDEPAFS
jgi:hypothetical protein